MLRHYRCSILFRLRLPRRLAVWYGWMPAPARSAAWRRCCGSWSCCRCSKSRSASTTRWSTPRCSRRWTRSGRSASCYGASCSRCSACGSSFPLAIVAIAAGIGPIEAVDLSLTNPAEYERIVSSAHVGIAGFGGAFLGDGRAEILLRRRQGRALDRRDRAPARRAVSAVKAVEIGLLLLALWGISTAARNRRSADVPGRRRPRHRHLHLRSRRSTPRSKCRTSARRLAGAAVRSGLGGFLYLNVLDASFSFDGVIGAFALSNNMVVIALGLSIGAIFVRSMTVHLVHRGTLAEYALPRAWRVLGDHRARRDHAVRRGGAHSGSRSPA